MSFTEVLVGIGIGVTTTVIATGITFYIKDYLEERAKFRKFKEKLEQIAGKNAQVIIPEIGNEKVKIIDINKQGVTVESQLCKTFIPIDKVFNSEISLPVENYDEVSKKLVTEEMKKTFDLMMPLIINKTKEMVVKEFGSGDSEISGVVALQVKTQLKEQGYLIKDKDGEKTPTFKEITDHFNKKDRGKKPNS